jgi:hypothetical protein
MANPEHVEMLKQGAEIWNRWRKENYLVQPNLSQVDLSNTDLRWFEQIMEVNFSYADLRVADLSGLSLLVYTDPKITDTIKDIQCNSKNS